MRPDLPWRLGFIVLGAIFFVIGATDEGITDQTACLFPYYLIYSGVVMIITGGIWQDFTYDTLISLDLMTFAVSAAVFIASHKCIGNTHLSVVISYIAAFFILILNIAITVVHCCNCFSEDL